MKTDTGTYSICLIVVVIPNMKLKNMTNKETIILYIQQMRLFCTNARTYATNRKLIFEDDILRVTGSLDTSGYGVVEYLQAGCQFFVNGYLDYPSPYHPRRKGEFHQPLQEWLCTEVIGNIYENPELLEEK